MLGEGAVSPGQNGAGTGENYTLFFLAKVTMPTTKRRKNLAAERAVRQELEAQNEQLRLQLLDEQQARSRGGGFGRNAIARQVSRQWDWNCICGAYNYGPRMHCRDPRCGKSRISYGETVTGTIRGVPQHSRQAQSARDDHARVPTFASVQKQTPSKPQLATTAPRQRAAPATQEGGGYAPSYLQIAAANTKRTTDSAAVISSRAKTVEPLTRVDADAVPKAARTAGTKPAAQAPITLSQRIAEDEQAQLEQENEDGDDDADPAPNPTLPEDLDYEAVQKEVRKYQRLLHRRQTRYSKQRQAIDDKEAYIAEQQAELVTLHVAADSTKADIQGFSCTLEDLHRRSTELAAQCAREVGDKPAAESPPVAVPEDGLQYMQRIARDLIAGAQNFNNEAPGVQQAMLQLVAALDAMRQHNAAQQSAASKCPGTLEQGQLTLQAAFAGERKPALAAPVADPNTSVTSVKAFDISDTAPQPSDSTTEQQSGPMQVVGQCLGDKRKRHDVLVAEAEAEAEREAIEEKPHGGTGSAAMEAQHLGTPLQPIGIGFAHEPFVPQSRKKLLEGLKLRDKQQARERRSRTEAHHQKCCPY